MGGRGPQQCSYLTVVVGSSNLPYCKVKLTRAKLCVNPTIDMAVPNLNQLELIANMCCRCQWLTFRCIEPGDRYAYSAKQRKQRKTTEVPGGRDSRRTSLLERKDRLQCFLEIESTWERNKRFLHTRRINSRLFKIQKIGLVNSRGSSRR